MSTPKPFRYPLRWRAMDFLEGAADRLWPSKLSRFTGWLFIAPALILVASLAAGLVEIADNSFRKLDVETFRMAEDYSLDNYRTAFASDVYLNVALRSLGGALLITSRILSEIWMPPSGW